MNILKEIMKSEGVKKVVAILLLVVLLFSIRSMFNLILLTFIFTFLFSSLQNFLYEKINKFIPVKRAWITVLVYASATAGLVIALVKYIPLLMKQLVAIGTQISTFQLDEYAESVDPRLFNVLKGIKIDEYVAKGAEALMDSVPHVGEFGLHIVLGLLLSFFFIMEKEKLAKFGESVERSRIGGVYSIYKHFGKSFLNSFGKVLNVQIMISFINAILSVIILGFLGFSQVIGLGFMIFISGLIPVAGVIVSFIPISIIAFTIGGLTKVLWVVVLITVLHVLESYILNPKLMSMKTELPIFLTFVTLIVGEHFIGIWGLLIGLPLFMFFLDIANINPSHEEQATSKIKEEPHETPLE
jgi:predicted PurR-regulated permease PerM